MRNNTEFFNSNLQVVVEFPVKVGDNIRVEKQMLFEVSIQHNTSLLIIHSFLVFLDLLNNESVKS